MPIEVLFKGEHMLIEKGAKGKILTDRGNKLSVEFSAQGFSEEWKKSIGVDPDNRCSIVITRPAKEFKAIEA